MASLARSWPDHSPSGLDARLRDSTNDSMGNSPMGAAPRSGGRASRGLTLAAAAAGILLGVLSGCGGGGRPPERIQSGRACLATLEQRGASFESRGDVEGR